MQKNCSLRQALLPARAIFQKFSAAKPTHLKTNQITGQGPQKRRTDHPEDLKLAALTQNCGYNDKGFPFKNGSKVQ